MLSTIYRVFPVTGECRKHLEEVVGPEAQWFGGGLVVEHRYVEDFINSLEEDGFENTKDFVVGL